MDLPQHTGGLAGFFHRTATDKHRWRRGGSPGGVDFTKSKARVTCPMEESRVTPSPMWPVVDEAKA